MTGAAPGDLPPPFSSASTIFSAIARHAGTSPEKTAIICGGTQLSYRELAERVSKVTAGLVARGVTPGQRIGVETDGAIDHLRGVIAAMSAGAIAVALPTDLQSCRGVAEDAEPALVLTTKRTFDAADEHTYKCPCVHVEDFSSGAADPGWSRLERAVRPEEIAMLYYTSGTSSGVRKGVMQSYGQLHHTVHYITRLMRMESSICEFVASPTDNAFWFGRLRCVLHVGGTAILSNGTLNPLSIVSAVNRHGGNAIAGDTAVFMILLHHMEKHLVRLAPKIRWVKMASAPMPVEDKRRLMEILPQAWIVMNYGLTEAMRTCLHPFRESPDKLASVGRPCPSVKVRIDGDNGREPAPGEVGEVLISGGNLASGYWRNEALWAERFRNGWYHSGDRGYLDEDGFLYLKGRIDHAINSGGKTIALSEVEDHLRPFMTHTTYAACGIDDPRGVLGEVVVLCVEGAWKESVPWDEQRIHLFEAMEQLLVPVAAYVVPEFPRTSNQKVQLNILRQRIEEGQYRTL